MNEVFQAKSSVPCFLSDENKLYSSNYKTMTYATELILFLVPVSSTKKGIPAEGPGSS